MKALRRSASDGHLIGLYPEVAVGGFSRVDGTVAFYVRVHALLAELGTDAAVLDFGAGRGACLEDPVLVRRQLRELRGRAGRVIGVDIDEAVLGNQAVDEQYLINVGERLPLSDGSIDLIVSDYTFEHVQDPAWVSRELDRVLRPGGWLCVRTPNRWGYIGLAARMVPNRLHIGLLRRLQPTKPPEDTFPTVYQLNTPAQFRHWFPTDRYRHVIWASDSEPAYVGGSVLATSVMKLLSAVTPSPLRSVLFVFLHKVHGVGAAVTRGDDRELAAPLARTRSQLGQGGPWVR